MIRTIPRQTRRNKRILELYRNGMSQAAIALRYDRSRERIRQIIRREEELEKAKKEREWKKKETKM